MRGEALPRWLKGKRIRRNLKCEGKVASRQKTRWLGQVALLVERSVGKGAKGKFWEPTRKDIGHPGK